jgi:hypothetical protein
MVSRDGCEGKTKVIEQDKNLLSVVRKALTYLPDARTVDDYVNATVVAIKAWDRMSDEAKQAAPESVRRFMQKR